jgi:hypothetical protein
MKILQTTTSTPSSEAREPRFLHKKTSPSEQTVVQSRDLTIPSQEAVSTSQTPMSKKPLSGAIIKTEEKTLEAKLSFLKSQTLSTSEAKTES